MKERKYREWLLYSAAKLLHNRVYGAEHAYFSAIVCVTWLLIASSSMVSVLYTTIKINE